jgi:NADPH:quinone reductase-like Zn-dependent oxidoreductase
LAKIPKGLDLIQAAALPLVTTTGNELISGTGIEAGQTVLVAGAAGNVGRSAVFTAKQRGATVIAGVLKKQIGEAKTIGAD